MPWLWPVPPLISVLDGARAGGRPAPAPAHQQERAPGDGEGGADPDHARQPRAHPFALHARDAVAGERAVLRAMARLLLGEALVHRHLVEPVGLVARLRAGRGM